MKIMVTAILLNILLYSLNAQSGNYVKDIDGNNYRTIKIGTQTWMAENLRTTHYSNGEKIPEVIKTMDWRNLTNNSKAYSFYENDSLSNLKIYGVLYTWNAAVNDTISSTIDKAGLIQGVCPINWHLPSQQEFEILINNLDGKEVAGCKLKEAGFEHWSKENKRASNESKFTALPGGARGTDGWFLFKGEGSYWWLSTIYNNEYAYYWGIYSAYCFVLNNSNPKKVGFSVRCIKN